jgi:hypothetical protein
MFILSGSIVNELEKFGLCPSASVFIIIIFFLAASVNSVDPWSDSHKSLTVATSQTPRSQSIPRIPGPSPLSSTAAATAAGRGVLSDALLGLMCWSLSKLLDCFEAGVN